MSEYTASNDTGSFSSINHKTKLVASGAAIQSATKTGAGQDAFCDTSGGGLIKGQNLELVGTTLWQPKIASLLWGSAKWGAVIPNNTSFLGEGLWENATVLGTSAIALSTTEGLSYEFTSAGATGNQAGLNRSRLFTNRSFNPTFKLRWKIDESGANIRFFAGWTSSTSVIGNNDDPLNALLGFGIGISTAQANYRIFHNDGVGATVSDDTGLPKDALYHSIELWASENNSGFYWSLDESTPILVTTEIPASTTSLSCQFLATAVNADAKILNAIKSVITSDK